jgi:glycosyltransferase involved in cell wall biosynthesis
VPVISFLGNTRPRKGLDIFLEAAKDVLQTTPAAHFLIAGGTPQEIAEYRAAHMSADDRTNIHFLGFCADVRPILWASDIFMMLSRVEPFARVNLEASAAGCAIIATAIGGNVEIFEDGTNALLVPAGDLNATRAALGRLLADPDLRQHLGQNAQAKVNETFSTLHCHSRIAAILANNPQAA